MIRFLAAILSTFLFGFIYSWISYVPISQRSPDVYYFGFLETFVFCIFYAGPIYLIAGVPISICIDKCMGRLNHASMKYDYLYRLSLYALAGTLVSVMYFMLVTYQITLREIILASLLGLAASLLYFHLLWLISIKINK